jgi:hypothetical protein
VQQQSDCQRCFQLREAVLQEWKLVLPWIRKIGLLWIFRSHSPQYHETFIKCLADDLLHINAASTIASKINNFKFSQFSGKMKMYITEE